MDRSQDEFSMEVEIPIENSTTEPIPTTSTFLSLPIEIKSIIIKMLSLQDSVYMNRTKDTSKKTTFGRSLNSMFKVNKEMSELAAVHIFDVSCNLIAR